jgi:nucleotide-binding universal stress UspA family protein
MIPFKSILHPTDFSTCSRSALAIACALARDYQATLVLLHVRPVADLAIGEFGALPPPPLEADESVQARLRDLLPANFAGKVECVARTGDAAGEILTAARQFQCDVIVLGTHGRSGLGRMLVGSVAEAVLRSAPCPVLTIKPPAAEAVSAARPAEQILNADDLATVYSVANAVEAEIVKNALANEGIRCTLESPQQGGIAGMMMFPIKIQVRAADADRAAKLLKKPRVGI